jgi:hypothetical protein
VLIRTTGISDTTRCHLIREERTQGTGLLRDSNQYPDSIFYRRYSSPTRYSNLDKQVVSLLYSGAIWPGYSQAQVTAAAQVTP